MIAARVARAVLLLAVATLAAAQQPVGESKAKGTPRPALTPSFLAIHAEWTKQRLLQDFNGRCQYREANAKLAAATDKRVLFFGDSITELWEQGDPALFEGDRISRGISGQTTAQMIGRFQHDVIALRPRVVHIMAGTNDIAGNTGPTTLCRIQANIRSMVQLAKVDRIGVVLAAVPPATHFNWQPSVRPAEQIRTLNAWIKAYAESERLVFVDYGQVLGDGHGGIKAELSGDGVHPNPEAYARMRPLAEAAIQEALPR